MPFIGQTSQKAKPATERKTVEDYTKLGYKIISDGPSGTQLAKKKMRTFDKLACALAGVLLLFVWPVSVFLLAVVGVDYWLLTKPDLVFVPSE